jgi:hypothetical protein
MPSTESSIGGVCGPPFGPFGVSVFSAFVFIRSSASEDDDESFILRAAFRSRRARP